MPPTPIGTLEKSGEFVHGEVTGVGLGTGVDIGDCGGVGVFNGEMNGVGIASVASTIAPKGGAVGGGAGFVHATAGVYVRVGTLRVGCRVAG